MGKTSKKSNARRRNRIRRQTAKAQEENTLKKTASSGPVYSTFAEGFAAAAEREQQKLDMHSRLAALLRDDDGADDEFEWSPGPQWFIEDDSDVADQ